MVMDRKIVEFDWDEGNRDKNKQKHRVTAREAEEVFFDDNKQEYPDPTHSEKELRKILVGSTKSGKLLFIVYTKRGKKVRIISARSLNKKKERGLYEKAT